MTEMVMPEHTNHLGTLFGGEAMRMMDVAAFVAATRHCRMSTVTRSIDQIDFHAPVSHGEIAELTARVIATGRTSMTTRRTAALGDECSTSPEIPRTIHLSTLGNSNVSSTPPGERAPPFFHCR